MKIKLKAEMIVSDEIRTASDENKQEYIPPKLISLPVSRFSIN